MFQRRFSAKLAVSNQIGSSGECGQTLRVLETLGVSGTHFLLTSHQIYPLANVTVAQSAGRYFQKGQN
jgi:hypothetical protein